MLPLVTNNLTQNTRFVHGNFLHCKVIFFCNKYTYVLYFLLTVLSIKYFELLPSLRQQVFV